jgi:hypothetical protein
VPPRRPSALAQHENGNSELVAASEMWSEPVPAVLPRPAEASKLDNWPDLRRNNVLPQGIRFRGAHRLSDRGPCGSSQPRGSSKSRRRECYGVPLGRVCEVCGTGHSCADLPGLWQGIPESNLYSDHLWKRPNKIRSARNFAARKASLRHWRDISLPWEDRNNTA